jgi:transposase
MSPRQQWRRWAIHSVVQQLQDSFSGVSEREIAWITGIPKSSVNRHITRMRATGELHVHPGQRRSVSLVVKT